MDAKHRKFTEEKPQIDADDVGTIAFDSSHRPRLLCVFYVF